MSARIPDKGTILPDFCASMMVGQAGNRVHRPTTWH
jgi:hypothetical protein